MESVVWGGPPTCAVVVVVDCGAVAEVVSAAGEVLSGRGAVAVVVEVIVDEGRDAAADGRRSDRADGNPRLTFGAEATGAS